MHSKAWAGGGGVAGLSFGALVTTAQYRCVNYTLWGSVDRYGTPKTDPDPWCPYVAYVSEGGATLLGLCIGTVFGVMVYLVAYVVHYSSR